MLLAIVPQGHMHFKAILHAGKKRKHEFRVGDFYRNTKKLPTETRKSCLL